MGGAIWIEEEKGLATYIIRKQNIVERRCHEEGSTGHISLYLLKNFLIH
jgi:hypothetical protein